MTAERLRVAVLGGTFDPVHNGHVVLAEAVPPAIGATQTWLIPARAPALRDEPVAPAHLRLAMLEAAARTIPGARVLNLEMRRPGVSYTIDTLETLAAEHGDVQPWWIVGADVARQLHAWHRSDDLLRIAHLAIVQRAGTPRLREAEARSLGLDAARTVVLDLVPPAVSASDVRARVMQGRSIAALVPPAVADIIAASGLYRSAPVVR